MEQWVGGSLPLFITWYPLVMLVALLGGLGPGLLATFGTVFIVAWRVVPPFGSFSIDRPEDKLAIALFALIGTAISVVAELYRRSRQRAATIEQELELHLSAAALRAATERQQFLASVVERASQAFAVGFPDGRLGLFNRAFEDLTGYSADELRGIDWSAKLTPDEWRDLESERIEELQRTGQPARYEKEYIRKDGSRVPIELIVHLARNAEGRPDYYFAFVNDISERRKAQEAIRAVNAELVAANVELRQSRRAAINLADDAVAARQEAERAARELEDSKARFQSHVENAGLAVIEWDRDFIITRWAGEAERLFGWSASERLGLRIADLGIVYEPDIPLVQATMAKLTSGPTGHVVSSNRNVTRDGRVIHCTWYNSVQTDSDGKMASVFSLVQDDTARVEAERFVRELNETLERRVADRTAEVRDLADQLRALAAELTQAEQRERKRLASILHDHIQQLLVAAQMQLEMMKRAEGRLAPSGIQGVESIINEAIAASRSLTVELSPPVLHQAGLAAGLSWLAIRMEEKHGFTVRVRADQAAEPTDENLRILLFESVRELLLNAAKHSGVRDAEVIMVRSPDHFTRIVVEDYGRGFDPRVVDLRRATGGFGLFSIQQRLAHVGGRLELESTLGEGTRAILMTPLPRMPLAGVELPLPRAHAYEPDALRVRGKSRRIRVVLADDHAIVRQGLSSLLQSAPDLDVVGEATNGREAVELARRVRPDVILMDVNMPEMDGIEATALIVGEMPDIRVVGLTMHGSPEVSSALLKAGAISCLTKGGRAEELIDSIRASAGKGFTAETPAILERDGEAPS